MNGSGATLLAFGASLVIVGLAVVVGIRLGVPQPVVLLIALLALVSIVRRL